MSIGGTLAQTFARDGCLTLAGIFDRNLIDAARKEFEHQFDLSTNPRPQGLKVGHRRLQLPIEVRGPIADPMLAAHPLLLKIVTDLLGADPVIDSVSCVVALPDANDQHLHRDYPTFGFNGTFAVTVAIPLIDLSEATGSTLLFPGSHLADVAPETGQRTERTIMVRGGCYLMDYALWHQGLANHSPEPRPVLYLVFARTWFIDDRNFRTHARINIRESELLKMPSHQRQLFRRVATKGDHDLTEGVVKSIGAI